ncbi:hypothetical protein INQ51_07285 [Maribellus sp. CM-23]|uniref:hypothetical protein n=1 Tax=Maribellus sp. CM-23 TaxID=2781026 RepID=UPI001F1B8D51|nr:hypothetical protein [Maribellus sp. CM-23]MCE4564110.1 hypothetical protein [Maribellus sp. CM-23]
MVANTKTSEVSSLEQWRVALENATQQPQIATLIGEMGYDSTVIEQGKNLLTETRTLYDANKTEDDETTEASEAFKNARTELSKIYTRHRKRARVVFLDEVVLLRRLALDTEVPRPYVKWLEAVKKFYAEAADSEIQTRLALLKITPEEITAATDLIAVVEAARANYLREVGESQDATKIKDEAMNRMATWMSRFYSVARIALEDNPQLLEVLGKPVKS